MNKLLLFLPILLSKSQLISITTCSDLSCNTNCNSWIANNNKCTDTNPYSITTYTSYSIYSDPNCNTIKPFTYSSPIILNGDCNQLYTYGNMLPSGSYKAVNLSVIIGSVVGTIIIITIIIICCVCYFQCCCKKTNYPPPNSAIIIDTSNNSYPPMNYGYPVIVNYPQHSAPNPNYYPQPSAPPANYYIQPSAPPANFNNII